MRAEGSQVKTIYGLPVEDFQLEVTGDRDISFSGILLSEVFTGEVDSLLPMARLYLTDTLKYVFWARCHGGLFQAEHIALVSQSFETVAEEAFVHEKFNNPDLVKKCFRVASEIDPKLASVFVKRI